MNSPGQLCPSCRFEFLPEEAEKTPGGRLCPRCHAPVTLPAEFLSEETPEPEVHLLSDGVIFDKYRIISFIGSGGMGEVYKAEHLLLKQIFALKVMKEIHTRNGSLAGKRFLREAKCFHLLDHPNIVRVFDIGCDKASGLLYISMEYLPGGSLKADPPEKFSEEEILSVASDIAKALLELEKNNMVHRDIKPSNIMRNAEGVCKLMDLGIAKNRWENADPVTLTQESCLIGTPAYASPEQCRTPHNVDIRSDIYSLGVTLYQLASGELPYKGDTPLETILNVINSEPPRLDHLDLALSRKTVRLIECMMAKSREDRPADARTLSKMIEEVRSDSAAPFRRQSPINRRAAAAALLGLGAAAAAGAALFYFSSSRVQELPPASDAAAEIPKNKEPVFLQSNFIAPEGVRGLERRLEEFGRILDFLNSDEAAELPFLKERSSYFSSCRAKVEKLLAKKNMRKERKKTAPPPEGLRKELETYLRKNKKPFFRRNHGSTKLVAAIINALHEKNMDPDTLFDDGSGSRRSLTGLALAGMLPMQEMLLKRAIFAGADIDAGHGPASPAPAGASAARIKARLLGIITFNGADNIDLLDGKSLLLSVLVPPHTYQVCLPTQDHVDWPLAEFLVQTGARLDVADEHKRTPLHYAARHNKGELLEKMVLAGCSTWQVRDADGFTPFQLAVRNHASDAVKVLKKYKMETPVSENDRAQGALLYAIISDEPLQAEQALDQGASLECLYANNLNALQNAVLFKRKHLIRFMLQRGGSFESNASQISLPGITVCVNAPGIFRMLLERVKNEKMIIKEGSSVTWLPAKVLSHYRRHPALAKEFFTAMAEQNWDINKPAGHFTVLEQALLYRDVHIDLIRNLLALGADPAALLSRKKVNLDKIAPEIRKILLAAAAKKSSSRP